MRCDRKKETGRQARSMAKDRTTFRVLLACFFHSYRIWSLPYLYIVGDWALSFPYVPSCTTRNHSGNLPSSLEYDHTGRHFDGPLTRADTLHQTLLTLLKQLGTRCGECKNAAAPLGRRTSKAPTVSTAWRDGEKLSLECTSPLGRFTLAEEAEGAVARRQPNLAVYFDLLHPGVEELLPSGALLRCWMEEESRNGRQTPSFAVGEGSVKPARS